MNSMCRTAACSKELRPSSLLGGRGFGVLEPQALDTGIHSARTNRLTKLGVESTPGLPTIDGFYLFFIR
jgi:hypothetical protein